MKSKTFAVIFASLLTVSTVAPGSSVERIINGIQVSQTSYPEVVPIRMVSGGFCTGVVVGKREILTAAHCVSNDGVAGDIIVGRRQTVAYFHRSPYWKDYSHDLAVGFTFDDLGVEPVSVALPPELDSKIEMLGFGCHNSAYEGSQTLRHGTSLITSADKDKPYFTSKGAGVCFGDSGSPAFLDYKGSREVVGIASAGNIKDTNYYTRFDTTESRAFFEQMIQDYDLEICGVNVLCERP